MNNLPPVTAIVGQPRVETMTSSSSSHVTNFLSHVSKTIFSYNWYVSIESLHSAEQKVVHRKNTVKYGTIVSYDSCVLGSSCAVN